MNNKIIILDRDGVINIDLPSSVLKMSQITIIDESKEAIRLLKEHDYQIVVATNQACVGRKELSFEQLIAINMKINKELDNRISKFYICPHTDADNCNCRKPKPGLLYSAWEDYHFKPEGTWFVGDAVRDFQAAQAFGCRFALVLTGKGLASQKELPDVLTFASLLDFSKSLLSGELK